MTDFNPCTECKSPLIKIFNRSYRAKNKIKFNYTAMCDNCGKITANHLTKTAAINTWNELNPIIFHPLPESEENKEFNELDHKLRKKTAEYPDGKIK